MKSILLSVLFVSLIIPLAYSQQGRGYMTFQLSPKICFTQNTSTIIYEDKTAKAGLGFDAHIGYGRTIPKYSAFAELTVGYASYRIAPDAREMYLFLDKNAFSHQFDFLQTALKIGFTHKCQGLPLTLAPYAGVRWLLYLPEESYNSDWVYVNDERVNSKDLIYARYSKRNGSYAVHAWVATGGIKVMYPITKKLTFTAAPFFDMGFKILRRDYFISERNFDVNEDVTSTATATSKGDALGIEFGLNFQPRK